MDIVIFAILLATSEAYVFSSIWFTKRINHTASTSHHEKLIPEVPHRWSKVAKPNPICQTDQCKKAAEALIENMNRTADPCENFYEFACGGWEKTHPMPPTEASWSQFDVAADKNLYEIKDILESDVDLNEPSPVTDIKMVYETCIKRDSSDTKEHLKPLLDLMSTMGGGWPMVSGNTWNDENFVWYETAADVIFQIFSSSIFGVFVSNDPKNTKAYVITVDQPSFVLPREMLVKSSTYKRQLEAYKTFIAETAWVLAKAAGRSDVTRSSILHEAEEMIEFEKKLANMASPREMRRNVLRTYNPMTLRDLQEWSDMAAPNQIDWLKYVRRITANLTLSFNWTERVIVRETDFIFRCIQLIQETSPRTIANYIHWGVVKHFVKDLTNKIHQLAFEFERVLSGAIDDKPRWKECISVANSALEMALGYSYVQKHFDNSAKLAALEMSDNIKSVFSEELGKLGWMDAATKELARQKVAAMARHIGYPAWFSNSSALVHYYEGLEVSDNHFNNVLYSSRFKFFRNFKRLRTTSDRDEWITSPAEVNAFFNPPKNSIIFPAAILQPPFFKKERLEALNYGAIGVIIGHEISHAFDDVGRQYDAEGNLAEWWTESTKETYLNKSQCFVNQYGNYRVPKLDGMLNAEAKLNGVNTLGENIADNGGLHSALVAYRKHVAKNGAEPGLPGLESFTAEQLFFLSFANNWCETITKESLLQSVLSDPHSPHSYRVLGTIQNSEDFPKIFNCPRKKVEACVMW
uniref:Membrane metallo-endopeptidase-like 1 n=1 Tax=Lygus hesperus TaxID=30085 RepID=A0A146LV20_LYGHE